MLFKRQKLMLALVESLGDNVRATDFQKHLFLFTRLFEKEKSYDFVPYRFGCYSFQASADKRKLVEKGCLRDGSTWRLAHPALSHRQAVTALERKGLDAYIASYGTMSGRKLIQHVYTNYPYFATRSEIASAYLPESELQKVLAARPKRRRSSAFFTLGYEGQSIEAYLNQLIQNDIRLLVDVRKNPISRKYGFSKSALSKHTASLGIIYKHMPGLGIPGKMRRNLKTDKDYEELFLHYDKKVLPQNTASIQLLIDLLAEYKRVGITCFERDHRQCHRSRVTSEVATKCESNVQFEHL